MTGYQLRPDDRRSSLAQMSAGTLDVLVVGGGVVGAGCALDAATRGLSVGLIEQSDWASGTSSRSSRLAHGGLRYLEQLEFGLVREALAERGLLLERLAPHLVSPVPFLLPLTRRGWERPYLGAGVAIYDALSRISRRGTRLAGHRHLSRRAVARLAPGIDPDTVVGAIGFHDAQIDDVRHTLAVVRTAASRGVLATSRVQVTGLLRDGDRATGVRALDAETGQQVEISARCVVMATGVWADDVPRWLRESAVPAPDDPAPAPDGVDSVGPAVRPSLGVHLVLPRSAIELHTALIARTASSVLFLLPWSDYWLVGTTDTPWEGDRDEPRASSADVEYLLEQANRWLVRPIGRQDVIGVYAGLRPLAVGDAEPGDTARISREHLVSRPVPGLVSVVGGKYTTYRVMAADTIDVVADELEDPVPASRTAFVPLVGAAGFRDMFERRAEIAEKAGLPVRDVGHLLGRHGSLAADVLSLVHIDPALGRRIHPDAPYLAAELVYAVENEDARHLDDLLFRRTRLALETRDHAVSVAEACARLVGPLLGWDDRVVTAELAAFASAAESYAAGL